MSNKKIIVGYRENDLYDRYMPPIVAEMQSAGAEVELLTVPRGTEPTVIQQALRERITDLKGASLFLDGTLADQLTQIDEFKGVIHDIDRYMAPTDEMGIRNLNLAGTYDEVVAAMQQVSDVFKKYFKTAIKKVEPKKIYIEKQWLSDHFPFNNQGAMIYMDDPFVEHSFLADEPLTQNPTPLIFGWLVESGYPEDQIEIVQNDTGTSEIPDLEEGSLLIVDRHYLGALAEGRGRQFFKTQELKEEFANKGISLLILGSVLNLQESIVAMGALPELDPEEISARFQESVHTLLNKS
jgi:5'(3')-deoxyribonucleotidase